MKRIEKIILTGCTFTVLISLLFFIFAQISSNESALSISFPRYLIITLFGFIIALANTVFEFERLHKAVKIIIHYAILLTAFLVIFAGGALSLDTAAGFFVAIIIFTILYALFTVLTLVIKKSISKIDSKIDSQNATQKPKEDKKSGSNYEPRFK